MNLPAICLTFDLEEFDLPLEYKQSISIEQQMEITTKGVDNLLEILDKYNVSCTFFTTANYAQHNPDVIKKIATKHEIASHSFFHSLFHLNDLKKSKDTLQEICGQEVVGFRMPRMADVDLAELRSAGYKYDSSLNPTCIPGRYNHFSRSKTIYKENGLTVFPAGVTPHIRTPLFWLSFKNFSSGWYCRQVAKCLKSYGYANIYLHPWEFADISGFSIPKYIAKDPVLMAGKLTFLLENFKDKARFVSIKSFLNERNEL
ncbi:MAG: polysaccharide deacetylase family protein [Bacteroidia bacterium]